MFWRKKEKELTFDQKERIAMDQLVGWAEFVQEQIDSVEDGLLPDLEMKVKDAEYLLRALKASADFIQEMHP